MRWLEHLRGDTEAFNDFVRFIDLQEKLAFDHFLNAKDMSGIELVKGRIEGMRSLRATIFAKEREAEHAAERLAQRQRAESGVSLVQH